MSEKIVAIKKNGRGRPKLSDEKVEEIRQTISSVAKDLFIRDGYEGVSMRKIASEVPYSYGVLYKHFKNKREVLQDIWDEIFSLSFEHCYAAAKGEKSTVDKLYKFCSAYVQYWSRHPEHFSMIFLQDERADSDAHYREHSFAYLKYEWVTELIIEGQANKEFISDGTSSHDIAESLFCICQGLSYRCITHAPREGKVEEDQRISDLTLRGFLQSIELKA